MPTASDLGQTGVNATTVYNKRGAQANAAAQALTHAQALQTNLSSDLSKQVQQTQNDLKSGTITAEQAQSNLNNIHRLATSDSAGAIQQNLKTQQGNAAANPLSTYQTVGADSANNQQTKYTQSIDPTTGMRTGVTSAVPKEPSRILLGQSGVKSAVAASDAAIDKKYADLAAQGGSIDSKAVEAEKQKARDNLYSQANIDAQTNANNQMGIKNEQTAGGATTTPTAPTAWTDVNKPQATTTPVDNHLGSILAGVDPSIIQGIQSTIDNGNQRIADIKKQLEQGAIDQKTAQDSIDQIEKEVKQNALDTKKKQLDFNDSQDALNRTAIENAKKDEMERIERDKAQAQLDGDIAYHNQQIQNTETELQNRNLAAKLGINYDTGGIKWMQTQQQKGVDALNLISRQMALNSVSFSNAAARISRDYTQNMAQAFQDSTKNYNEAIKNYNDAIANASKDKSTQTNSLRQYYATQKENLSKDIYQIDKDTGDIYRDLYKDLSAQSTALRKEKLDSLIKTKDTLGFTSDLRKEMGQDDVIKLSDKVMTTYTAFDKVWDQSQKETKQLKADPNSTTRLGSDQTLITLFNKLSDPASVVRESEYDRTPGGGSLWDNWTGQIEKLKTSGGSGLTQKGRNELYETATAIKEAYDKTLQDRVAPYFIDIQHFNAQDNLQSKVDYKSFPEFKYVQLPQDTFDTWEKSGYDTSYNTSGTENTGGSLTFLSPDNAPPNGYRTDRNNNPTAFTTSIAKQAGLVLGVDYEEGSPFPNNPNIKTAKLIGNPVDKTIQVIDKVGFYTQKGSQRWTHTAIDDKAWKSMTYDQKAKVVAQMYQKEGGTGQLLQTQQPVIAQRNFTPANYSPVI